MIRCCNCKKEKEVEEFNKTNIKKKSPWCRICIKEYDNNYREKNKLKISLKSKEWRTLNKEQKYNNDREYRKNNPDKQKTYRENYLSKDSVKENKRIYLNGYRTREEVKQRRNSNPITSWRRIVKNVLRNLGQIKEDKTHELLGYSALDLKNHLESLFLPGMTWNNRSEWHIDHIRPVSSFSPETSASIVNALINLQPLWKVDNLKKSNKY